MKAEEVEAVTLKPPEQHHPLGVEAVTPKLPEPLLPHLREQFLPLLGLLVGQTTRRG